MTDKQQKRIKSFGDKMANDSGILACVVTVWDREGITETNWSGLQHPDKGPQLALVEDIDDAEIVGES